MQILPNLAKHFHCEGFAREGGHRLHHIVEGLRFREVKSLHKEAQLVVEA